MRRPHVNKPEENASTFVLNKLRGFLSFQLLQIQAASILAHGLVVFQRDTVISYSACYPRDLSTRICHVESQELVRSGSQYGAKIVSSCPVPVMPVSH